MVGPYVKARRMELGMTQEELGDALGRDQKYISRLETEYSRFPAPSDLRALAASTQDGDPPASPATTDDSERARIVPMAHSAGSRNSSRNCPPQGLTPYTRTGILVTSPVR